MPKHVLKSLELTTLLVALDHLEEYGPDAALSDPYAAPGECAYVTYIGEAQAEALAARLPHANVTFKVPGGTGRSRLVRKVFNKAAILHLMRFAFPNSDEFAPFVRGLDTVDRQYWKVLDADGKPIPPPPDKRTGKG